MRLDSRKSRRELSFRLTLIGAWLLIAFGTACATYMVVGMFGGTLDFSTYLAAAALITLCVQAWQEAERESRTRGRL